MNPSSTPVGSVLAYAGSNLANLGPNWLPCDGRQLSNTQSKELFDAIGTSNGGRPGPNGFFKLPDLQGMFLRGLDTGAAQHGGKTVDPDVKTRRAAAPGGNSGVKPGSEQGYATANIAHRPISAIAHHVPTESVTANIGSLIGPEAAIFLNKTTPVAFTGGGDKESRPVNKYVNYIIKASSGILNQTVEIPVGSVVPYAGPRSPGPGQGWLLCDGRSLAVAQYSALFDAIGTEHGGDGKTSFYIPDFRGYFLRGVSGTRNTDPDADTRSVARPDLPKGQQGNHGNAVGSAQSYATGKPAREFKMDTSGLPVQGHRVDHVLGREAAAWNPSGLLLRTEPGTGDYETRPVNLYIDWYIKAS